MTFLDRFKCNDYDEAKTIDEFLHGLSQDHVVQLKYDGIWGQVHIDRSSYSVYSKTGNLKSSGGLQPDFFNYGPTVLLGEFMYGTEWSNRENREGQIFVFDCLVLRGKDLSNHPYGERYRAGVSIAMALGYPFRVAPNYHITKASALWHHIVAQNSHEGLIARDWTAPFATPGLVKIKREVEDDFVIMECLPGKPDGKYFDTLGAFRLGQYNEQGVLEEVMTCGGGMSDEFRNKVWQNKSAYTSAVALVKGNDRFESGALRSPQLVRIRDDKLPTQCLLKKSLK